MRLNILTLAIRAALWPGSQWALLNMLNNGDR